MSDSVGKPMCEWVCFTYHGLSQCLLDKGDTTLVNRLAVGEEAALQRCGNRRQTLEQWEEIFVFILQLVPLGNQWRHQFLYVLLKTHKFEFGLSLYHTTKQGFVQTCVFLSSQFRSDGVPLSLPVFRWHHKEWAGSCADTSQMQKPACPGWSSDRAPALYTPLPLEWRTHFSKDKMVKR